MFLAYNIIFNLHILPVNFMIILKEISLEIFPPMLEQNKGEALNGEDVIAPVNPQSYIDIVHGKVPDEQNYDQAHPWGGHS
jgi:hypothetical protein